jgi:4-methyl-5(b-hydroxyethyl)-thiazole monophosphate biosynthesis
MNEKEVIMSKNAIVFLAEGFEEVEAITPVDYLRRAGIAVTVAAIGESLTVKGARGITVTANATLQDLVQAEKAGTASWDTVIVPGGMPGAANISASKEATALISEMASDGKLVCAICASPAIVLAPLGLLSGKKCTCYPGMEKKVQTSALADTATWTDERVVIDGKIITSRGAGTAGEFAIAVITQLLGKKEGDEIAKTVLL